MSLNQICSVAVWSYYSAALVIRGRSNIGTAAVYMRSLSDACDVVDVSPSARGADRPNQGFNVWSMAVTWQSHSNDLLEPAYAQVR